MKCTIGLLVALLSLNGVFTLPAGSPSDDAEVINVPRRPFSFSDDADTDVADPDFKGFRGVIDTGAGYPFLQPSPHAFSFNLGFFDSFEDIFRRLRTRLWPVQLPGGLGGLPDSGDSSEEGGLVFNPKNGNTTSTVKVVDGHKIEVNETVYGDANNVFKVRVVNIRPVDSDEEVEQSPVDTKKTENNPSTSAPNYNVPNGNDDDSDDRREPLENKQTDDNEIRGNIDDAELSTAAQQPEQVAQEEQQEAEEEEEEEAFITTTTMLPTTNEDNTVAFIADNSLEGENGSGNGNIEAETNKSVNNSSNDDNDGNDGNDEDAEAAESFLVENDEALDAVSGSSSLVENERLTIDDQNNEETTEVNDNFNESSAENADADADADESDDATETAAALEADELTKELNEFEVSTDGSKAATEKNEYDEDDDDDDLRAELEQDSSDKDMNVRNAGEFDDEFGADERDSNAQYTANYAKKHREDVSSSDEEENVEMNSAFNSEWASLAEDLANTNDRDNDLSNEIDAYDIVPIDLSNDIAVNDIAAANPNKFPINPDAELLAGAAISSASSSSMPMFEKLSLGAAMNPTGYQSGVNSQNMK